MNTLFKKWDFWFWLIAIFYILTVYGSDNSHIKGLALIGILLFVGFPVLFIYIVLKALEKTIVKIRAGEDKSKNIILLVVIVALAIVVGKSIFGLYFS